MHSKQIGQNTLRENSGKKTIMMKWNTDRVHCTKQKNTTMAVRIYIGSFFSEWNRTEMERNDDTAKALIEPHIVFVNTRKSIPTFIRIRIILY